MNVLGSFTRNSIALGVAAFLLSVGPGISLAESVLGHGKVLNGDASPSQVSVRAWRDDDGSVDGTVIWIGDVLPGSEPTGGIAQPWFLDVVDLVVEGNTAFVLAVVVHSLFPEDIGLEADFVFIDNSAMGSPDEIITPGGQGGEIVAGNITVTD